MPEVGLRPAGYVGWRGLVDERDLPGEVAAGLADGITYFAAPGTHIVVYPIPDAVGEVAPGRRRVNYVWYRNLDAPELDALLADGEAAAPLGAAGRRARGAGRGPRAAARGELPAALAAVVAATAQPFVQAIADLASPRVAVGRVAVIGDAAFVARPHAAAGTAKACADAWALGAALAAAGGDVEAALPRLGAAAPRGRPRARRARRDERRPLPVRRRVDARRPLAGVRALSSR